MHPIDDALSPYTRVVHRRGRRSRILRIYRVVPGCCRWQTPCLLTGCQRSHRRSWMFARFITALTVVLALSAPAWAADRKDLQVARDVSKQVLTYSQFSIFDSVHMQVDSGIVTL